MTAKPAASADSMNDAPKRKNGSSLIEFLVAFAFVIAFLGLLVAFMLPATRVSRPVVYRTQCKNNLKQIALALHNYESIYHVLPPAYTIDANGKPLHSWRTLILPYLDQQPLYQKIDLSKAWDDPANAEAYQRSVSVFRCPEAKCPANQTTYMAIVASNGCFRATEPRLLSEITDGHANTLMVIELDSQHAVPWMAPRDADEKLVLDFGPKTGLAHTGGMHAAFVDGHIDFLVATMPAGQRRALISIAGKDN